jgi:hypothetical protein
VNVGECWLEIDQFSSHAEQTGLACFFQLVINTIRAHYDDIENVKMHVAVGGVTSLHSNDTIMM